MSRNIYMVLSGGGAKCFSYLGIMEILYENNISINHFVTSSMGSLIGIFLAHQIPIPEIKEAFFSRCKRSYWFRPKLSKTSLTSQRPLQLLMQDILPSNKIKDCKIPISIIATNLYTLKETIIEKGNAIDAVCASSSHPIFNSPILLAGVPHGDGGITNNVPSDICRSLAGDSGLVITASCITPFNKSPERLPRSDLLMRAIYHTFEKQRKNIADTYSDVVINPFRNTFFTFKTWTEILRFYNRRELEIHYKRGKLAAIEQLPKILDLLS